MARLAEKERKCAAGAAAVRINREKIMRLYLIRHGETDWNKKRKLQGQIDIPLNEFGRRLALETAPALADIPFDLVITSPLRRAKQTAELVLAGRGIPMREEGRLMEMAFGAFEGLVCKGENYNIPDPEFHRFYDDPAGYVPPRGGESFHDVMVRLNDFWNDLNADASLQDKIVLVSLHGAVLCGLLTILKGKTVSEFWGGGVHKNCAVTLVEVEEGRPKIVFENRTYYKENVEDW